MFINCSVSANVQKVPEGALSAVTYPELRVSFHLSTSYCIRIYFRLMHNVSSPTSAQKSKPILVRRLDETTPFQRRLSAKTQNVQGRSHPCSRYASDPSILSRCHSKKATSSEVSRSKRQASNGRRSPREKLVSIPRRRMRHRHSRQRSPYLRPRPVLALAHAAAAAAAFVGRCRARPRAALTAGSVCSSAAQRGAAKRFQRRRFKQELTSDRGGEAQAGRAATCCYPGRRERQLAGGPPTGAGKPRKLQLRRRRAAGRQRAAGGSAGARAAAAAGRTERAPVLRAWPLAAWAKRESGSGRPQAAARRRRGGVAVAALSAPVAGPATTPSAMDRSAGDLQLIRFVRQYQYLYDTGSDNYKNVKLKDNTWKKIALALGLSVEVSKTRWKSLRTSYLRHCKLMACRKKESSKCRKWPLADELSFLNPYLVPTDYVGGEEREEAEAEARTRKAGAEEEQEEAEARKKRKESRGRPIRGKMKNEKRPEENDKRQHENEKRQMKNEKRQMTERESRMKNEKRQRKDEKGQDEEPRRQRSRKHEERERGR
ncbi:Uncharacterized protein GBIM_12662 [Gryllus bimaculatus]|nr:Uncharacterized protein GBIM_12662 [Gryllus bimaculatus]